LAVGRSRGRATEFDRDVPGLSIVLVPVNTVPRHFHSTSDDDVLR
jgi:hypothetical protein